MEHLQIHPDWILCKATIPSTRDRDLTCHPYSQAPSSDLRRLAEGDAKTAPAEAGQAQRAVY
jgi:hypothetical protein